MSANLLHVAHKFQATREGSGQDKKPVADCSGVDKEGGYGKLIFIPRHEGREGSGTGAVPTRRAANYKSRMQSLHERLSFCRVVCFSNAFFALVCPLSLTVVVVVVAYVIVVAVHAI